MAIPMIADLLAPLKGLLGGQGGQQGATGGGGGNILQDLLGGLFGLGGAGLAGLGAAAGERRKKEKWERQLSMLRPDQPYYGVERGLSQIDPVVQKVIMGMLGQRGIPMESFGIDPMQMLAGLGQQGGQTPARVGRPSPARSRETI